MGVRPLYRWKSFWLGILVMGFLSWAWWDSLHQMSWLSYEGWNVRHAGSGISVDDERRATGGRLFWSRAKLGLNPWDDGVWMEGRLDAPEVLRVRGDYQQFNDYYVFPEFDGRSMPRNAAALHFNGLLIPPVAGAWAVYVPHWLVMVCFVIPWAGFLVWRGRRERRVC